MPGRFTSRGTAQVVGGRSYAGATITKEGDMGAATLDSLSTQQARDELTQLVATLGELDKARALSSAGLLSDGDEVRLRRAEELAWLLSEE